MATEYKILGQIAPLATTETDLYEVPASTQTIVSTLVICNRSASNVLVRVSVSAGGGVTADADYILYDMTILAGTYGPYMATIGLTLEATDVVRVYASTADLSISLFGSETT
jgi:hypothetical protein